MNQQTPDPVSDDPPETDEAETADPDELDEPDETEGGPDESADEGEPGADDEEQDEPETRDDGKVVLTQKQFDALMGRGTPPATPPTPTKDPLEEDFEATLKDEKLPPHLKRVMLGLARRTARAEQEAVRVGEESKALARIPAQHRDKVEALVDTYKIPPLVALQLHKGDLYDKAVAKNRAKRKGEPPPKDEPPAPQRTRTPHTSIRPIRGDGGGPGTNGPTVTIQGIKVPKEFPSPTAYTRFLDTLPPDKQALVYKARKFGVAAKIRGEG
jgi:hypothetical protein